LTAGGSQSKDGKAALVQVYLRGNQGTALANQSVDSIRKIVATPPPGVKAYVTGAAPLITDNFEVGSRHPQGHRHHLPGDREMLLFVYRSITTMLIMLVTVAVELAAARGEGGRTGALGPIGLSTYSTNLLTLLAIAAGTDYAIFIVGRYHEARLKGWNEKTPTTTCSWNRARHHRIRPSPVPLRAYTSPGCRTSRPWASRPPSVFW
jgi:RND superfamily putative drug exporter